MRPRNIIIAIAVGAIALNAVIFVVVKLSRARQEPAAVSPVLAHEPQDEMLARARRAAGVAALEQGDYDRALIQFTEARSLAGPKANVDELLRITDDLRKRSDSPKVEPAKSPEPVRVEAVAEPVRIAPEPHRPAPARPPQPVKAAPVRVASVSPPPQPEKPAPAPEPEKSAANPSGLLLVSTTPRGLLVQLDGAALDLTPLRAPVRIGIHKVAIYDGDRKLYETTVDVGEGNVASVLRDLSAEMAPPPSSTPAPAPAPTPAAAEPTPVVATSSKPARPDPAPAAAPPPEVAKTGGLAISAPGLYGEVWVAHRPYGMSPVTVDNLAPGQVDIEIRVNGETKRTKKVSVEPGKVLTVKVR